MQWCGASFATLLRMHDNIPRFTRMCPNDYNCGMLSIKPLPGFTQWLEALPDASVRGVVLARIKRLSLGLMGDVSPVGEGVSEMRIHVGAGWRVYFVQRGKEVIVLLAGGSKRTQVADIKRAKALANLLD